MDKTELSFWLKLQSECSCYWHIRTGTKKNWLIPVNYKLFSHLCEQNAADECVCLGESHWDVSYCVISKSRIYVTDIMLCNLSLSLSLAHTHTHQRTRTHTHTRRHVFLAGYTPTQALACVHMHTQTLKHTLFCLRAPFSFMWGQSLPVITALISATGTAERTDDS